MNTVVPLPPSVKFSPEQALQSAGQLDPKDVLIVGYDADGDLFVRSSRMSRMDAVFLLEIAKRHAIESE